MTSRPPPFARPGAMLGSEGCVVASSVCSNCAEARVKRSQGHRRARRGCVVLTEAGASTSVERCVAPRTRRPKAGDPRRRRGAAPAAARRRSSRRSVSRQVAREPSKPKQTRARSQVRIQSKRPPRRTPRLDSRVARGIRAKAHAAPTHRRPPDGGKKEQSASTRRDRHARERAPKREDIATVSGSPRMSHTTTLRSDPGEPRHQNTQAHE